MMDEPPAPKHAPPPDRKTRAAAALRANLARRKAQRRGRREAEAEPSESPTLRPDIPADDQG